MSAQAIPSALRAVYPWTPVRLPVDGGEISVIDEGPRDADVLLCLHGNPTWSFYWREIVAKFADRYRVVVPDHIGCGMSDKPQDWPYRLRGHVDNVLSVIEQLGLGDRPQRITLLVHDWGGAIGMGVATLRPDLFRRFVVTNTAAWPSPRIPPSIAVCKIPGFGALAVRGFNGFARAAVIRATHRGLSEIAQTGLLWPYQSWQDRIATLRFVEDIPMGSWHPSWVELSRIGGSLALLAERPMLLCWGNDDFCFTPKFLAEWRERFPKARVNAWDDVGHYVMEDAPERVVALVEAFLAETSVGSAG